MILAIYRLVVFLLWFGVMFALCTILTAVALFVVTGAVVMGLATPSRTVAGQVRSVQLHAREGVALIQGLGSR